MQILPCGDRSPAQVGDLRGVGQGSYVALLQVYRLVLGQSDVAFWSNRYFQTEEDDCPQMIECAYSKNGRTAAVIRASPKLTEYI